MTDSQSTAQSPEQRVSSTSPQQTQKPAEDDCMPCRLVGGGTFIGLGIYTATLSNENFHGAPSPSVKNTWWTRFLHKNAGAMRGSLAVGFIGLGVYRIFVGRFSDRLVAF